MCTTTTKETYKKRSRAKYGQEKYIKALISLDSELKEGYTNTLYCSSVIQQQGKKFTSSYCGYRWCKICNRIRTGKLINGYQAEIDKMQDKQFVTLTRRNVSAEDLRATIIKMTKTIRLIADLRRKQKLHPIKAIRKIEVTYNPDKNNYHPHLHFIVEGKQEAEYILDAWLKRHPLEANLQAQDIRPAENPIELFKYFTKLTAKTSQGESAYYVEALDKIFIAMKDLRVFQPSGGIKKVSEIVENQETQILEEAQESTSIWLHIDKDWFNMETGEALSDYIPTKKERKFRNKIRYLPKIVTDEQQNIFNSNRWSCGSIFLSARENFKWN